MAKTDVFNHDMPGWNSTYDVQRWVAWELNPLCPPPPEDHDSGSDPRWAWVIETRQAVADMWPKRRRTKKIICPISLIYTDHPSGVDYKVWRLLEDAIRLRHEEEERRAGGILCCWDYYWGYVGTVHAPGTLNLKQKDTARIGSIPDLYCRSNNIKVFQDHCPTGWSPDKRTYLDKDWKTRETVEKVFMEDARWLPVYREMPNRTHDRKVHSAYMTPAQADALTALVTGWDWHTENTIHNARMEGHSLLLGLATGTLATSDFDAKVETK